MSETFELNARETRLLELVCDTLVPSIERDDDAPDFWRRAASDLEVAAAVTGVIATQTPAQQRQFRQLLALLASPLCSLSPRGPHRPFDRLGPAEREALLARWSRSAIPQLRQGFQALKRLACFLFYTLPPGSDNPNWPAIGFEGPLSPPPAIEPPIRPYTGPERVLDCDVVVVGSGAGGGVVAGELAAAGHDVIVVEKGPYVAEDGYTQREIDMMPALYEARGSLASRDLGVAVLAGSCLGGGTTINWSGAFRPPDYILEEWAREHLLPHLLSRDFAASVDAVAAATHVTDDASPCNPQNQRLYDGAVARGAHVQPIPRNVVDCDFPACGYCGLGCQRGAKQGMLKTYLRRAHEHGARILVETTALRVLSDRGRAVGIEALRAPDATGRRSALLIRARRVVVAAGAIHTPALLRRSGLRHPHIGRHLYLHPTVAVAGRYAEPIDPWHGVMMAVVSNEWAHLDGSFGVKIETPPVQPGLLALAVPWRSGEGHKRLMRDARHLASFIVLTRDRDGGRIRVDREGRPRIDYRLSGYDRHHMLRGVVEAARLHEAAGAEWLLLPHLEHGPVATHEIERVATEIEGWNWAPNRYTLFSAHQMGTCRMGGDAGRHPLTPESETRELPGLYVTDASVFPAASGVNPMLTIESMAHYASSGIRATL